MKLTVLSPTVEALRELRPEWEDAVEEAGLKGATLEEVLTALQKRTALRPEDELVLGEKVVNVESMARTIFVPDDTKPNGSSIAVLAEYDGKRCLLTGDAHAPLLEATLKRLLAEGLPEKLKLDALKVPHHGSRANISIALLQLLDCPRYLFSSNGKKYHHPHPEAVARIIAHGGDHPTLYFNYRTECNEMWDELKLKEDRRTPYEAVYPKDGESRLVEL